MMKLIKLSEYFNIHNGVAKGGLDVVQNKFNNKYIFYIRPSNSYSGTFDGYLNRNNVKFNKISPCGTIYVSTNGEGSHTYSYVSSFEFVPNSNVVALIAKVQLSIEEKLFYAKCITNNRHKFSYLRKPKYNRLKDILIPIKNSIPEFVYKKKIKTIATQVLCNDKIKLNKERWQEFKLNSLFDIAGTKTTKLNILAESGKGKYPYITTKAKNNGCDGFYDIKTESGNVITIDAAVVGYASYQSEDFSASIHVKKLTLKCTLNKYIAMFLTTILNKEQHRFYYGRKASQDRLEKLNIKLPVTSKSTPDWEFMENYIKSLPYSSSL